MWTRGELKRKAKSSFKMNYWKTVLIAMLVVSLLGAAGGASSASSAITGSTNTQSVETGAEYTPDELEAWAERYDEALSDPDASPEELMGMFDELGGTSSSSSSATPLTPALALILFVIVLVVIIVAIILEALIFNPLQVGTSRFFFTNLSQPAEVKEVAFGYDHNYRQNVKTLLWRDIYIFLWSLLLIIPGIIKSYEYRMIPYLLSEDETMTKQRAFAESKRLMHGQKWRAFVLDLSFCGWYLLSVLTLGLLAVFYVNPYKYMTDAALYEKLRYGAPVGGDHFVRAAAPAAQAPAPPSGPDNPWGE